MILSFNTQLKGKPTFFVEKILKGLIENGCYENHHDEVKKIITELASDKMVFYHRMWELIFEQNSKLHTLRDDINNRWKEGNKIDFFINCRQPNMFRFAPVRKVVRTQEVFMTYSHSDLIQISIDGRELFGYYERLEFAKNDGFDNWEDFFEYFLPKIKEAPNKCYKPKLIHWTNLRY